MLKRVVATVIFLTFAFLILFISILRSASIKYSFSNNYPESKDKNTLREEARLSGFNINYNLAYAGPVLPDSPFWPIKAIRDRLWLLITPDIIQRSQLNLLFADKRLQAAGILFERGQNDLAYTTLTKSVKYLENTSDLEKLARNKGVEHLDLTETLANALLRHRQMIREIALIVPEDIRPKLTLLDDKIKTLFQEKMSYLASKGIVTIKDPFDGN